ncbi:MAG: peptidoglycan DD-metalloendopeptidase family protein [Clostridia bacterium]|nr:peptidoglycan DD-metalloendopeptidase family protein [Clostridia bacterium]
MLENIYTTKMSADKKQLQNRFLKIRSKSGLFSRIMAFIMTLFIAVTMLLTTVVMAALNSETDKELITFYSNGEIIKLKNKPFIKDNMTYFPLRETFEKLGVFEIKANQLIWDDGTIHITVTEAMEKEPVAYTIKLNSDTIDIKHSKDSRITNNNVKPVMNVKLQLPQETPLLVGDKTYVPYTFVDYMLNRGLGIRNHTGKFNFMFTVNTETPGAFISQGFVWPCGGEISNRFGEREHPVTKEKKKHNGIDIAAVEGTDVNSAISGTVTETGFDNEQGFFIVIERDNIKTVYSQLMQGTTVTEGDEVLRGETIGKVGKTGTSTGAHLHFEVLINGEYFNPELVS